MDFQLDFYESGNYNSKWTMVTASSSQHDARYDSGYSAQAPRCFIAQSYEIMRNGATVTPGVPNSITQYYIRFHNLTELGINIAAPFAGDVLIVYGRDTLPSTIEQYDVQPTQAGDTSAYINYQVVTHVGRGNRIRFEFDQYGFYKPYITDNDGNVLYKDYMPMFVIDRTLVQNSTYTAYPDDGVKNGKYFCRYQSPTSFIITKKSLVNGVEFEQSAANRDSMSAVNLAYGKMSCNCFLESWMEVRNKKCKLSIIEDGTTTQIGVFTIVSADYNNRTYYYSLLGYDDMYKLQQDASNWMNHYSEDYGIYEHYRWTTFTRGNIDRHLQDNYIIYYNSDGHLDVEFDDEGNLKITRPSNSWTFSTVDSNTITSLYNTLAHPNFTFILDPYGLTSSEYPAIIMTSITSVVGTGSYEGGYAYVDFKGGYYGLLTNWVSGKYLEPSNEFQRYRNYETTDLTLNNHIHVVDQKVFAEVAINLKSALPSQSTIEDVLESIINYLGLTVEVANLSYIGSFSNSVINSYQDPSEAGTFAELITKLFAWSESMLMWCNREGKVRFGGYGNYWTNAGHYNTVLATLDNTLYVNFVRSKDSFVTIGNMDKVQIKCDAIDGFVEFPNEYYVENGAIRTIDSPWFSGLSEATILDRATYMLYQYNEYANYLDSTRASLTTLSFTGETKKINIFGKITVTGECSFIVNELRINSSGIYAACNINLENINI